MALRSGRVLFQPRPKGVRAAVCVRRQQLHLLPALPFQQVLVQDPLDVVPVRRRQRRRRRRQPSHRRQSRYDVFEAAANN